MIKKILFIIFTLISVVTNAQESNGPQMADSWREDGKIYVVIAVLSIIFACVIIYLAVIERKLKKLEEELKNKNSWKRFTLLE